MSERERVLSAPHAALAALLKEADSQEWEHGLHFDNMAAWLAAHGVRVEAAARSLPPEPSAPQDEIRAAAIELHTAKRLVRDELAAVHRGGKLSYSYSMPSWRRECDAERELEIAVRRFLDDSGRAVGSPEPTP